MHSSPPANVGRQITPESEELDAAEYSPILNEIFRNPEKARYELEVDDKNYTYCFAKEQIIVCYDNVLVTSYSVFKTNSSAEYDHPRFAKHGIIRAEVLRDPLATDRVEYWKASKRKDHSLVCYVNNESFEELDAASEMSARRVDFTRLLDELLVCIQPYCFYGHHDLFALCQTKKSLDINEVVNIYIHMLEKTDRLHSTGYIAQDTSLGNFVYDCLAKKTYLIDPRAVAIGLPAEHNITAGPFSIYLKVQNGFEEVSPAYDILGLGHVSCMLFAHYLGGKFVQKASQFEAFVYKRYYPIQLASLEEIRESHYALLVKAEMEEWLRSIETVLPLLHDKCQQFFHMVSAMMRNPQNQNIKDLLAKTRRNLIEMDTPYFPVWPLAGELISTVLPIRPSLDLEPKSAEDGEFGPDHHPTKTLPVIEVTFATSMALERKRTTCIPKPPYRGRPRLFIPQQLEEKTESSGQSKYIKFWKGL